MAANESRIDKLFNLYESLSSKQFSNILKKILDSDSLGEAQFHRKN